MNWSWSSSLYDGPLMFNTELWWRSLSNKALVRTGSPNTSGHFENVRFVVKIVLDFSYLFAMRLKNRLAVSASIFSYPNSSTIRSLYLHIHLILCCSLFSYLAFLSCAMRSWNEIQYTEYLCLAASVFIVELMYHKRRSAFYSLWNYNELFTCYSLFSVITYIFDYFLYFVSYNWPNSDLCMRFQL